MNWTQLAINPAAAIALGSPIGAERQWRQRMVGLRTNDLVAIGVGNVRHARHALARRQASPHIEGNFVCRRKTTQLSNSAVARLHGRYRLLLPSWLSRTVTTGQFPVEGSASPELPSAGVVLIPLSGTKDGSVMTTAN